MHNVRKINWHFSLTSVFVLGLIVSGATFPKTVLAIGEIWLNTPTVVQYTGGINEPIVQAQVSATVYSFDYYGTYGFSGSMDMDDTIQYVLWQKNSGGAWVDQRDCYSDISSASTHGLSQWPDESFVHIEMTGTECDVTEDLYYGFRVYINLSGTPEPTLVTAFGASSGTVTTATYLRVNGTPTVNNDYSTHIIDIVSPPDQSPYINSDTTVDFDIDYYSGSPTAQNICIEIQNLTVFQTLVPLCEDVIVSGEANFATTTTLLTDNFYRFRVFIRGTNNEIIDTSSMRYFSIITAPVTVYNPEEYEDIFGEIPFPVATTTLVRDATLECDPGDSFFPRSICNLALLLFVPSTASIGEIAGSLDELQTKLPFSAVTEFKVAWAEANYTASTSPSTLSLSIMSTTTEIISPSSLENIGVDDDVLDTLKTLIVIALWVSFAWFCFLRVSKFF